MFDEETEAVTVTTAATQDPIVVKHDTHIMDEVSMAKMGRLPAAFEPGGIVTAGNASAVVDGAAAMVIARADDAKGAGKKPLARIAGMGDPECVNPTGGAIALGHPLGATGAILTLTCAYGLKRTNKKYGLVTMCIGGGQGIALIIENLAS